MKVHSSVRTQVRRCRVCELPAEQREKLEKAMRGEGGTVQSVVRELGLTISQPLFSRHKRECLGICGSQTPNAQSTAVEVVPRFVGGLPVAWVPIDAQTKARSRLLEGLDKIEAQIALTPTAAYYQVRLEYIKEVLKEAEKGGGALGDRMKNYMEEVKSRKREVTRTVTMKETVTEVANDEPAGETITVEGEASPL